MTENRPSQPDGLPSKQTSETNSMQRRVDRRQLLRRAVGFGLSVPVVAAILDACKKGSSSESPAATAFSSPAVSPAASVDNGTPGSIGNGATGARATESPTVLATPDVLKPLEITASYLTTPFRKVFPVTSTTEFGYMTRKPGGVDKVAVKDMISDMQINWNLDATLDFDTVKNQPVTSLEALLSLTVLGGLENDTVDFTPTSDALKDFRMPRVTLSNTGGKTEETFTNTTPPGWTVRKDAHLVVIGTYTDRNNVKQALVSVDDSLRKPKEVTLSIASVPLTLDQTKEGETSLTDLLKASGTTLDTDKGTVTLPSGKETLLNTIDSGLVDLILNQAGGIYFMDKDPLKKNPDKTPVLNENPVVPYPPSGILYDGPPQLLSDGRLVVMKDGKPVARFTDFGEWITGENVSKLFMRELAEKLGWDIGTVFAGPILSNEKLQTIVKEQFNLNVIAWGVAWSAIEPTQGQFDFSILDRQIALAQANEAKIRGQALVFPSEAPVWLKKDSISRDDAIVILQNHIKTIMTKYKGVISEWTVVNEPYLPPYRTDDILHKLIGTDYIDIAFQAARDADPSAVLIYNDSNNHASSGPNGLTTTYTQETIQRLKGKGLVDRVGVQMHLKGKTPPDPLDVIHTLQSYGVPVCITEFDIDMENVSGTEEQRYAQEAQLTKSMVEAVRQSNVCKSFNFWGVGDNYSWIETNLHHDQGDATLYDGNLNPKPMRTAVEEALAA